ncbi:hypothetical protein ES705_06714 [subsurface metagenome]
MLPFKSASSTSDCFSKLKEYSKMPDLWKIIKSYILLVKTTNKSGLLTARKIINPIKIM